MNKNREIEIYEKIGTVELPTQIEDIHLFIHQTLNGNTVDILYGLYAFYQRVGIDNLIHSRNRNEIRNDGYILSYLISTYKLYK